MKRLIVIRISVVQVLCNLHSIALDYMYLYSDAITRLWAKGRCELILANVPHSVFVSGKLF